MNPGVVQFRAQILAEIKRLSEDADGQPIGQMAFAKLTGISEGQWKGRFWARWSDAVSEAGLTPNKAAPRKDNSERLEFLAKAVRQFGRFPTGPELSLFALSNPGSPALRTIKNRFPRKEEMVSAIRNFARGNAIYSDILPLLPDVSDYDDKVSPAGSEGWVYLLKSGQHFKIGRSDTLEQRIKQISIALPERVDMVHAIRTDDSVGIEAYWHRRFASKQANGEWFALDTRDVQAFKKRKFM